MRLPPTGRTAVVWGLFALLYLCLAVSGSRQKSATWDEPQNLTSGYAALAAHDYRVDPEHPPFLRIFAAWPLRAQHGIRLETAEIGSEREGSWLGVGQLSFCHRFCYQWNDADRMLHPARFMIILLGLLLGGLVFLWARELFGLLPAAAVLALFLLEPNLLAHAQLVTTDLGVTCFIFGAVYFAWRTARRISAGNLLGLVLFFSLSQVSKFSALPLGPLLLVFFLGRASRADGWTMIRAGWKIPRARVQTAGVEQPSGPSGQRTLDTRSARLLAAGAILAGLLVAAYLTAWAVYGFRYAPAEGDPSRVCLQTQGYEKQALPALSGLVDWVDRHHLLPNALSQGFLLGQSKAQIRPAYLAGAYRITGWWYYFPAAFLLKTPLAVILLFLAGVYVRLRGHRDLREDSAFMLLPVAVFLGAAVFARLNIGLRHILPVYPFVLLACGAALAKLAGRKRLVICGLAGALTLFEFFTAAPDYLTFFNSLAGGPGRGDRWLVDSNLDWGQDLKGLKLWMDRNRVPEINLSYFGTADPAYYGIACTLLPPAPFFAEDRVAAPKLPGYVAVSRTNLRGAYSSARLRAIYEPLLSRQPVAVIGHSINVYRLEAPWW